MDMRLRTLNARLRTLTLLHWILTGWVGGLLAYAVIGGDGVWWKF
jgi:hypothetical protein